MRKMGSFEFPEKSGPNCHIECDEWKPVLRRVMLHRQVMCLAKTRVEVTWNAYCFPVPGINHDNEEHLWEYKGSKLLSSIALILFPDFEGIPYAN